MSIFALLWMPSSSFADQLDGAQPQIFNFYGEAGLLDMPTARMNPDGEMSATASITPTMDRYNLGFVALPWLETTFRYSRIDRYLIGTQGDLYDRSLSIKVRLSQERDYWPSIVVGAQDILGTGAFGAEYLVASKHIGDFDVTGGIGWRRFGGVLQFSNPFGLIIPSFKTNENFNSIAGGFSLNKFFHGENAGLIGGVSWQTPIKGLQLIAELSGDTFTRETKVGSIDVKSHINLGFSYEPFDGVQIGAGYLYGTQFGVRMTLFTNAFDQSYPQRLGTPPTEMSVRPPDVRNDVELTDLQDATHYYKNWPQTKDLSAAQTAQLTSNDIPGTFADTVFDRKSVGNLRIQNIETYGDSLIIELRGARSAPSCAQIAPLIDSAAASGFSQIAFSTSTDPADVKICAAGHVAMPERTPSVQNADFKVADTGEIAITAAGSGENTNVMSPDPASIREKIVKDADDQGITVDGFLMNGKQIDVAFENGRYRTETEAIGRLVRILSADAPAGIADFRLVSVSEYVPQRAIVLHRANIERIYELSASASELLPVTDVLPVSDNDRSVEEGSVLDFPAFNYGLAPGYRQSLFDPDNPYRYGIYATASAAVAFSRNIALSGAFEFNIYNTFNISRVSNSVLPHVRSDFALYLKHGENGIASLTAQYLTKFSPEVYFLGRAGYLESMYGGFGGEVYWQPSPKRFSFGAALYAVQQRNFDELFGFRNYRVITGHLSAYYESPYHGIDLELHVGRYLAGDYGATFQITRRFDSGIEIGAYATLTNVPFSKFGEGSFDKGFIIHIPVDFLVPLNTQSVLQMDFSPLTRDGGQRLDGEESLFYITRRTSESELLPTWNEVMQP